MNQKTIKFKPPVIGPINGQNKCPLFVRIKETIIEAVDGFKVMLPMAFVLAIGFFIGGLNGRCDNLELMEECGMISAGFLWLAYLVKK